MQIESMGTLGAGLILPVSTNIQLGHRCPSSKNCEMTTDMRWKFLAVGMVGADTWRPMRGGEVSGNPSTPYRLSRSVRF